MGKQYYRVQRGMIFWFDPKAYVGADFDEFVAYNGRKYKSSILKKKRPYLVVSNNSTNTYSNTCTIVPITTSQNKTDIPSHVKFTFEGETHTILCEQARTVDIMALDMYYYTLSEEVMEKVDTAIENYFGLKLRYTPENFNLDNTVKTLEKMVDKILKNRIQAFEEEKNKQMVPISQIEDAAFRLSDMIETLLGCPEIAVATKPAEPKNTDNPYKGMNQVEKFNKRYGLNGAEQTILDGPTKTTDSKKKCSPKSKKTSKKKRKVWTRQSMEAYLKDGEVLSTDEMIAKYKMSSKASVYRTKNYCKTALEKLKEEVTV